MEDVNWRMAAAVGWGYACGLMLIGPPLVALNAWRIAIWMRGER